MATIEKVYYSFCSAHHVMELATTRPNLFDSPEMEFTPSLLGSIVMGELSDEGDKDTGMIASSAQDLDKGAEENHDVILFSMRIDGGDVNIPKTSIVPLKISKRTPVAATEV